MPIIPMIMPVPRARDGREPKVSDDWHQRKDKFHYGNDLMYRRIKDKEPFALPRGSENYYVPEGTPAIAAADGTVTTSEEIGTGGLVRIQHTPTVKTGYFHLTNRKVRVGQFVKAGTVVGIVGHDVKEGKYPLDHLHFEVYENDKAVDPAPYIKQARSIPMPVLVGGGLLLAIGLGAAAWWFFVYRKR